MPVKGALCAAAGPSAAQWVREQKSVCTYKALSCRNHETGSVGGKQTGSPNCWAHINPSLDFVLHKLYRKMRGREPVLKCNPKIL